MSREADSWDDAVGAEVYAELVSGGRLYPALADGLLELVDPPSEAVLVDLACGTGLIAERWLPSAAPEAAVVGVDAAPAMLEVGRRRVADPRAAFLLAHVGALPLAPAGCDAALCSAALWHFPGLRCALGEIARVLRPGGRVAFNVPAAQLRDADDLPPAPLQLALARVGERRFGEPPRAAGPKLRRSDLLTWCTESGFAPSYQRFRDLQLSQQELADLLSVPALGARIYPEADEAAREAWIAQALSSVEPEEEVAVRWWEVLLGR